MRINIKKYQTNAGVFFLFLSVALLLYYPILSFSFFQDDFVWMSSAKDILQDWRLITTVRISNFFMPAVYAYFTGIFLLFHTNPLPYYVLQIVIHSLNAFLLYILLKKITMKPLFPMLGALFFLTARYPMEAIVWISAATVLITTFFLLVSTLLWIKFIYHTADIPTPKKIFWYSLFFLSSLCLMATKEWSVLLLPFLCMVTIALHTQNIIHLDRVSLKKLFFSLLPLVLLFLAYLAWEFSLQGQSSPLLARGYYIFGFHAVPVIVQNTLLLFWPLPQLAHGVPAIWLTLSVGSLALLLGIGFWLWRQRHRLFLLGLAWIIVAYVPTSFFTWNPFVGRYAYLPAIGASMMIVSFLQYASGKRWLMRAVVLTLFAAFLGNSFFVFKILRTHYRPAHKEKTLFVQAVKTVGATLHSYERIGIYDNTPVKGFILPEVMHAIADIPKKNVRVISEPAPCPDEVYCIRWEPVGHTFYHP